jgi:hypothetical protein
LIWLSLPSRHALVSAASDMRFKIQDRRDYKTKSVRKTLAIADAPEKAVDQYRLDTGRYPTGSPVAFAYRPAGFFKYASWNAAIALAASLADFSSTAFWRYLEPNSICTASMPVRLWLP